MSISSSDRKSILWGISTDVRSCGPSREREEEEDDEESEGEDDEGEGGEGEGGRGNGREWWC